MNSEKQIQQFFTMLGTVLVVCRNHDGRYLIVKEAKGKGWGIPGGIVSPPDSFPKAAIKLAQSQTGIEMELKGILRMEFKIQKQEIFERFKIVFFAEPKSEKYEVKNVTDKKIEEVAWASVAEIEALKSQGPGWKGPEIYNWPKYLEDGGVIFPLSVLGKEASEVPVVKISASTTIKG